MLKLNNDSPLRVTVDTSAATTRLKNFRKNMVALGPANKAIRIYGRVTSVDATGIRVSGLSRIARLGDIVKICEGDRTCLAETISVDQSSTTVKPLSFGVSAQLDMPVEYIGEMTFRPSNAWIGRVLSAVAEPLDGHGALDLGNVDVSLHNPPPAATNRAVIMEGITTGVRCIDIFTPLCFGQRIGIFAGSGVGKSTLLAMIARSEGFDVVVIALVGERGREVNEFIHEVLGEAIKKSVLIVATGDEAPGMRKMAPMLATRLAEFYRDQNKRVLLIMDSVTRFALAAREIALAAGEPPVARGYPPSVFSELPRLLERAGPGVDGIGSITGVYSVLVDGDNHNEPVADAVRGILDGHIVLDREISNSGRYPAIDVLSSISRLAPKAWKSMEGKLAGEARQLVNKFESSKDMRLLGSYQSGSDKEMDQAIEIVPKIYSYLTQTARSEPDVQPFTILAHILKPQRGNQAATNSRPTS
jgi:flagellum-specific ATP synthase